jgi:hypothetical protein
VLARLRGLLGRRRARSDGAHSDDALREDERRRLEAERQRRASEAMIAQHQAYVRSIDGSSGFGSF